MLKKFPEHLLGVDTIQKGALLARGGTAKVFNGKYGVIPVALKEAVESLDALLNEAATIMKLKHPNVVQVYGIWKHRNQRVFMVVLTIIICGFTSNLKNISATIVFSVRELHSRFWSYA